MLTWKENTMFKYKTGGFQEIEHYSFQHEGWGIEIVPTPNWIANKYN